MMYVVQNLGLLFLLLSYCCFLPCVVGFNEIELPLEPLTSGVDDCVAEVGNKWKLPWKDMEFFKEICDEEYSTKESIVCDSARDQIVTGECGSSDYDLSLVVDGSFYFYVAPKEKKNKGICPSFIIASTPKGGNLNEKKHEKLKTMVKICDEKPKKKLEKEYTLDFGTFTLVAINRAFEAANLDAKGMEGQGFDLAKNHHGFFLLNIFEELGVLTKKKKQKIKKLVLKRYLKGIYKNFKNAGLKLAKKLGFKGSEKKSKKAKKKVLKSIVDSTLDL